jgi:hypothetical protein
MRASGGGDVVVLADYFHSANCDDRALRGAE